MSYDQILITRYPNRRLYNTNSSEYINLSGVESLVKEGQNIKIIDRETKEDLTKHYLLQIITDYENKEGNILSENMLTEIIKSYTNTAQKVMPDMVEKTFEFYKKQQDEFFKHVNSKDVNPFSNETSSETIKEWQSKQFQFMKGLLNPLEETNKDDESSDKKTSFDVKDEIEILKKQMFEIKEELNKKK